MAETILFINNTYISNWEELKNLIILSFGSNSSQFKYIQDEILSSARDGNFYGWAIKHNLKFSHVLGPNNFTEMTDGELEEVLLNLCGAKSSTVNRPSFKNHLEIISEYSIIENDMQNRYPIKTPIPMPKSQNSELKIGLRVINPVNDRIDIALVKHNKADVISWSKLKNIYSIDLKEKGYIHYITIDIAGLKSYESVGLYADGELIQTFKSSLGYMDLGVGLKWGTCNLGAERPTEKGDEFAWGESKPKRRLNIDAILNEINQIHFLSHVGSHTSRQYNDAATVILGEKWRVPTKEEWESLYENCDASYFEKDGVPCIKFTSKINNKYIIFPIELHWNREKVFSNDDIFARGNSRIDGFSGCYWSATASTFDGYAENNIGQIMLANREFMIRPVYDEEK